LLVFAAVLLPSCTMPDLAVPTKPDFVSEVRISNPNGDVRAFRIDIEEKDRSEPKARHTLAPIPLDERGLIPAQVHSPPTDGPVHTLLGPVEVRSQYSVLVRAYRPGYLTIDIKPGAETRWLHWVRADSFEQEMAIDVLLGVERRIGKKGWWEWGYQGVQSELVQVSVCRTCDKYLSLGDQGLQPGSVSKTHREVLLFAASEYERLAIVAADQEARQRLKSKASQMKRYADEITTDEFYGRQSNVTSR
jgi:hypothetical protein